MPRDAAPWSLTLREVGLRLEGMRERSNLTQSAVARHEILEQRGVRIDVSGLSRLESGRRRRVPQDLVLALLDCYEADPTEHDEVLALLQADTTPTGRPRPALWRRNAHLLGPMQLEGFLAMEARAAHLANFEPHVWPGLLQTPEYARLVITELLPDLRPSEVRTLVDVRLARQHEIRKGAVKSFHALIEESVLRRTAGDRTLTRRQLERALADSEQDRFELRILPEGLGLHQGASGPFVIMTFPEAGREVVWVETLVSSVYLETEGDVQRYSRAFTSLWDRALTREESRALLTRTIKEL